MGWKSTSAHCIVVLTAAVIAAAVGTAGATQAAKAAKPSSLELLSPFVGADYAIDAKWEGGGPSLKAREEWSWGLNKKFVVCKVFVQKTEAEGGGEYQQYESIFYDEKGTLMGTHLDFTGHVRAGAYATDGNVLTEEWKVMGSGGNEMTMKQILTLKTGDDGRATGYGWKVFAKRPTGEWSIMMDGEWRRK